MEMQICSSVKNRIFFLFLSHCFAKNNIEMEIIACKSLQDMKTCFLALVVTSIVIDRKLYYR